MNNITVNEVKRSMQLERLDNITCYAAMVDYCAEYIKRYTTCYISLDNAAAAVNSLSIEELKKLYSKCINKESFIFLWHYVNDGVLKKLYYVNYLNDIKNITSAITASGINKILLDEYSLKDRLYTIVYSKDNNTAYITRKYNYSHNIGNEAPPLLEGYYIALNDPDAFYYLSNDLQAEATNYTALYGSYEEYKNKFLNVLNKILSIEELKPYTI